MSEPDDLDPAPESAPPPHRRGPLPALPVAVRIGVLIVGWIVVLIGVAGLALPGIQGCLTIAVGAALLSLASEMIYRGLHRLLARWPKILDRIEHFRGWLHDRLSRKTES